MHKIAISRWSELESLKPNYALAGGVDLVIVLWEGEEQVSVLYGRCAHRGAVMADGRIEGDNIVCGLHDWDYEYKTGVSAYNSAERLHRFNAWAATQEDDPRLHGRQVVSVSGDGGFGQYLAEINTAVKYGMNITHVLMNNGELGKISNEQRAGNWEV
jgi:nitrite reductase/ring-hydroxylating ferredoxin subunit